MKLSIITVNLNNRNGLQKTIDSVVFQTFRDFEWIVIDGGSTDGSKELIEQYADHFAYWVSEPDKGIYNAMNKGIKVAKGEYLQFLNSGDWLYSNDTLDRVFSIMPNADIAYGNMALMDNEQITEIREYPDALSFATLYSLSLPHPSSFIRSALLKESPYDESLKIVSDWKFFLQKALENRSFVHISVTVSCFNLSGLSSTNKELLDKEREIVTSDNIPECILYDIKYLDELIKNLPDAQMKALIKYRSDSKTLHKIITALLLFYLKKGRHVEQ